MATRKETVHTLLAEAGRTYAAQAGIKLQDKPAPLYRLLVLSLLLSTRIKADIAVAAARELADAGLGTPRRMLDAGWQERVDALGRANYKRYDEQTATALGDGAQLLLDRYSGDLRKLRSRAGGDPARIRELLTEFPRVGPVGADIFSREAQAVWPELRPALDGKVLDGARRVGLPDSAAKLAKLTAEEQFAELAAALVRVSLDKKLADRIANP